MKSLMVTLWERIQFWKTPKKPQLDIDYEFHNFPDSDLTGIRILSGKYREVIYYYGIVKFSELDIMEMGRLSFEFRIVDAAKFTVEQLHNDDDFVIMIGDILSETIINESLRENNTEEFDLQ